MPYIYIQHLQTIIIEIMIAVINRILHVPWTISLTHFWTYFNNSANRTIIPNHIIHHQDMENTRDLLDKTLTI